MLEIPHKGYLFYLITSEVQAIRRDIFLGTSNNSKFTDS
jgi:hypothetical protein